MSLENLYFKPGISGFNGHVTFTAKVCDEKEWKPQNDFLSLTGLQNFRIKIRIIGVDDPSKEILPDEDARWAIVCSPAHLGGGSKGLGETLVLSGGETVTGYFLDGEDGQQAVVTSLFNCSFKDAVNHLNPDNGYLSEYSTLLKDHQFNSEIYSFDFPTTLYLPQTEGTVASISYADATNIKISSFSICGTDTVSKTKERISEFIKILRNTETGGRNIIDPVTNEILQMQNDVAVLKGQTTGILKGAINLLRKKIIKAINKEVKKKIEKDKTSKEGKDKGIDNSEKKSRNLITGIIGCLFKGILGSIGGFIANMFNNLLNNVLNGALCAVEQFVSGIFAKVFDSIEKGLQSLAGGLSFLSGGLGKITGLLRKAGSFASGLLDFLDKCLPEDEKCINIDFGSKAWSSSTNSSVKEKKDDWESQVKNINIFRNISDGLAKKQEEIIKSGEDVEDLDYNGVPLKDTINMTSTLTGGTSNALLNKGLGSIESAISNSSLFGLGNNTFDPCNRKMDNPTSQEDITPVRPGYLFPSCIPPIAEVSGSGSGAELFVIVGNDRRIFSIEVINGGSGYEEHAGISIIDNTGNGTGAYARAIVENGSITQVVLMSTGFGYCLNTVDKESPVGIGTNVIGTLDGVFVDKPGYGYDENDTVVVGDANLPIITSPSGSIGEVTVPSNFNAEFTTTPSLTMNTRTGVGVKLIPIMKFKGQLKTDIGADERRARPLVGIDQVIDCIGDKNELVGYVNGVEYYGPFHIHPNKGVKMVGAQHVDYPHEIIYDTMEESLGQPPVVSQSSSVTSTETTETSETTTPVDTTPTIVTEQTTSTPTTPVIDTTTSTDTSSSTDTTPPSTPPSGGGGYGGGY